MEDLCSVAPKKTRFDALANVNLEGLTESQKNRMNVDFDNLLGMGYSEKEAIEEMNLWADDIRASAFVDTQREEARRIAMEEKEIERIRLGKPTPNLEGDVSLKRLKAFLKWLNGSIVNLDISDAMILEQMSADWSDVVDVPMTRYYSDFDGFRVFVIGGGGVDMNQAGQMYYTDASPIIPDQTF